MTWSAALDINYSIINGRVNYKAKHNGPLLVQKPFFYNNNNTLHHYLLHPPGGLVGGDDLAISLSMTGQGNVLLTSPSAQKVYKTVAGVAKNSIEINLEKDSQLFWLPQETILFNGAEFQNNVQIKLSSESTLVFWDLITFGRAAINESFLNGKYDGSIHISRDDTLIFRDKLQVNGGDELFSLPIGLNSKSYYGQLCIIAPDLDSFASQLEGQSDQLFWSVYENMLQVRGLDLTMSSLRKSFESIIEQFTIFSNLNYMPPRVWAY